MFSALMNIISAWRIVHCIGEIFINAQERYDDLCGGVMSALGVFRALEDILSALEDISSALGRYQYCYGASRMP